MSAGLVGIAKLADVIAFAISVGIERAPLVAHVRELEARGATPDEITDSIQKMAEDSEKEMLATRSTAQE